jgi:hypothetical protein
MADRTRCRHAELFIPAQRHASLARRLEDMAPNRPATELERERLTRHLGELIAALDARVPRLERAGESRIADEAEALRKTAMQRIVELDGKR